MVNPIRAGLAFGVFIGFMHAGWSALVATNLAQKLVDFIFWAHFITPVLHIEAFEPVRAGILVGVTFIVGFFGGLIGAVIWNLFHR